MKSTKLVYLPAFFPLIFSFYILVEGGKERVDGKMGYAVGIHSVIYFLMFIFLLFIANLLIKKKVRKT